MDAVVSARIRLEGARALSDPAPLFAVLERARARSLVDLLHSRPLADTRKPAELRAGERRITALQMQLLRTTNRASRQRLLDEIFRAEEALAPMTTELFTRARRSARSPVSVRAVQEALRQDEVLFEIALAEPASFGIVVTRSSARVQPLPARPAIVAQADALVSRVRSGSSSAAEAKMLGTSLFGGLRELVTHPRLVVSADGILQQVPFELLEPPSPACVRHAIVISHSTGS